jgi:uncharacterized protein YbcI
MRITFTLVPDRAMNQLTKGALEASIANAVTKFHREQQGRGPQDVRAFIVGEMILVRCSGIFTLTESKLCVSDEGRKLIQSARRELRSINHQEIEEIIADLCSCPVLRSYCDLNVEAAEQVEVYILERNLEKLFATKG